MQIPEGAQISIHAPANGATLFPVRKLFRFAISIHAPANGATQSIFTIKQSFEISIHAPANGATSLDSCHTYSLQISIHAPANGATIIKCQTIIGHGFQSTLRRTERHRARTRAQMALYFNPRSGERSDSNGCAPVGLGARFQSTLRRTERLTC